MKKKEVRSSFSMEEDCRDETFDILKGIAILFVIIGHGGVGPLRAFIFSFHMPLFFFVAGYFLKIRPLNKEIGLSLKRLIIPYIFSAACMFVVVAIRNYVDNAWEDVSYMKDFAVKFLLGFKGGVAPEWIDGTIMTFWFVWAMFWARSFVVFLLGKIQSMKALCVIFFFLGPLGVFLGENVFVPYCIPLGMSAAGFVYVGYLVNRFKLLDSSKVLVFFPLLLICWLYNWMQRGMDMALFWYPSGYVFDLLGALGAFFALFKFVKAFCCKESLFWRVVYFCGRYSLVIYCVHAIDENLNDWLFFASHHQIPFEYRDVILLLIRLVITFIVALLILRIKFLREDVFQIKR